VGSAAGTLWPTASARLVVTNPVTPSAQPALVTNAEEPFATDRATDRSAARSVPQATALSVVGEPAADLGWDVAGTLLGRLGRTLLAVIDAPTSRSASPGSRRRACWAVRR
jgi:hypothetical protein